MNFLKIVSSLLLISLSAPAQNFSRSEDALSVAEALRIPYKGGDDGKMFAQVCSTDIPNEDSNRARRLAGTVLGVAGGFACLFVAPICLVGLSAFGFLRELNDHFVKRPEDLARETCKAVPDKIPEYDRELWQDICYEVVLAANIDSVRNAGEKNGHTMEPAVPVSKSGYGLNDTFTYWRLDGQDIKRVEALRVAQHELRRYFQRTSCLSDVETSSQIELTSEKDLTVGVAVDLMYDNIVKYGRRAFLSVPGSDRFRAKSKFDKSNIANHAKIYLEARAAGRFEQYFSKNRDPDIKFDSASLLGTAFRNIRTGWYLEKREEKDQSHWTTLVLLDEWAKKQL